MSMGNLKTKQTHDEMKSEKTFLNAARLWRAAANGGVRRTQLASKESRIGAAKLTHSSSFSMPVGIWGTARLMAAKSGRSGISSARKTGIGLLASRARALKESFDIVDGVASRSK